MTNLIVTVRDPEILSHLDPQRLTTYLQAHGWQQESQIDDKESVWFKTTVRGEEFDITLPLNPSIRAYALRMSEILDTLERDEGRSQLDILSDLITTVPTTEVQGMVIQVLEGQSAGNVTMMGFVVGKLHPVQVRLGEGEFSLAVKAYRERQPVVCTGDLVKEGGSFVLKNLRNFALFTDV